MGDLFRFNDTLRDAVVHNDGELANEIERRLEQYLEFPTVSVLKTADTGRRIEILSDASNKIRFYSGETGETDNGVLNTQQSGGREIAVWTPPEFGTAGTYRAQILMYARTASLTSLITQQSDAFQFIAATSGEYAFTNAPVRLIDGTAGAPALAFSSDTDLGIYRVGANSGGLSANGALTLNWGTFGTALTVMNTTGSAVNVHATGSNILQKFTSSIRYKDQIEERNDGGWILELRPVKFHHVGDDGTYLGMIAEEVADAEPLAAVKDLQGLIDSYDQNAVIAGLVALCQQQQAQINDIQERLPC